MTLHTQILMGVFAIFAIGEITLKTGPKSAYAFDSTELTMTFLRWTRLSSPVQKPSVN